MSAIRVRRLSKAERIAFAEEVNAEIGARMRYTEASAFIAECEHVWGYGMTEEEARRDIELALRGE